MFFQCSIFFAMFRNFYRANSPEERFDILFSVLPYEVPAIDISRMQIPESQSPFYYNLVSTINDLFSYIIMFHPFGFLSQKINMINPVIGPEGNVLWT